MPDEQPTLPPSEQNTSRQADATLPPSVGGTPGAALLSPGTVTLPLVMGRYRLEQLLGQGGMGAVYRAYDTQLGRAVALKVPFLSGNAAASIKGRFLREAQAAAALSHPNICPVYDLGEIDGVPYITMAFVEGEPLSKRLTPGKPMPVRDAVSIVRRVAEGLAEAHRRGVIHRDLKPANVMIDARGEPVVMDFGLARRADAGLQMTQQGEMMGTPAYMPPEQVEGDVKAMGPACDIYSLGAMLYEMLAGRLPFKGDVLSLLAQIAGDDPAPPSRHRPSLPQELDHVCLKALAKRPGDRQRSMRELGDALAAFLAKPPVVLEALPVSETGGPRLGLRVQGTTLAYRSAPGQASVSLGRQKRRTGEGPEAGNDVVLRIPGNDALSARISRRHLEIVRGAEGFAAVNRGKAGTLLNGKPLPDGSPVPLKTGDRLVIAGVLTLEVEASGSAGIAKGGEQSAVVGEGRDRTEVILEATLGDMVTME